MNTATFADLQQLPELVVIIDFKWLMAGVGVRVHVERLQCDRDYAAVCLGQGAASHIPALRDCAQHLAGLLHIMLPCADSP